jgi:hypothetical protein
MEWWMRGLQPVVMANEATLSVTSAAPFTPSSPTVQVLQCTLPVPQPLTVILEPRTTEQQYSPIEALPAEATGAFGEFALFAGRYIVTWGMGQKGGFLFTDLAPGSIQLPATNYVSVRAFAQGAGSVLVGAAIMPGGVLPDGSTTYTRTIRTAVDVLVPGIPRVPFARELSAQFCVISTADNDYPSAELDVQAMRGGLVPTGRWRMPAPLVPNPQTMPQFLRYEPIAGSVTEFDVAISGIAGVAGVQATANVIQTVRP